MESLSQKKWPSHLGCDKLQGFLFGRPMERDRFFATWHHETIGIGAPAA